MFKGELCLDDILNKLPKKRLLDLRDARVKRIVDEKKAMDAETNRVQSNNIRESILRK